MTARQQFNFFSLEGKIFEGKLLSADIIFCIKININFDILLTQLDHFKPNSADIVLKMFLRIAKVMIKNSL